MKKLFLAVYFTLFTFSVTIANAGMQSFADPVQADQFSKTKKGIKKDTKKPIPYYKTMEEMFEKRLDKALVTNISDEELKSTSSQSVVPSQETIDTMNESKKSFFQKVYENAIGRATSDGPSYTQNVLANTPPQTSEQQQQEWAKPTYQTVNVTLPSGEKILAPALEHISYLLAEIDLLPNGTAKINEKIIVVANGEKLKYGLSKALPKFSISRQGSESKLDINLVSVKIDGQEIDYKINEVGNNLILEPKREYELQPGVYTYDFEYIINNQLWTYDDFNEFYWNITGNYWNLIIARAGAIVRIPGTEQELGKAGYLYSDGRADFSIVRAFNLDKTTIGIASLGPIFIGESLQTVISIPKKSFLPSSGGLIFNIVSDYGDIILALFGLIAVVGGYIVSWIFISTDKKTKEKYSISQTGPILRYLTKNIFDKISFGAFLLELYKKRIIDIKNQDGKTFLIRISDTQVGLSNLEKAALENLFPKGETLFEANSNNILKINRAYKATNIDTKNKVRKFLFKINFGYIGLSSLMLVLSQLGIAFLSYNPLNNFFFMVFIDILVALAITIIAHKTKSFAQYIYKPLALTAIAFLTVLLGIIISTLATIAILITILAIFIFTKLFSSQNGLIKNNIERAKKREEDLIQNITENAKERNFIVQQPAIFAFELSDKYDEALGEKDYNKLISIKEIIKII